MRKGPPNRARDRADPATAVHTVAGWGRIGRVAEGDEGVSTGGSNEPLSSPNKLKLCTRWSLRVAFEQVIREIRLIRQLTCRKIDAIDGDWHPAHCIIFSSGRWVRALERKTCQHLFRLDIIQAGQVPAVIHIVWGNYDSFLCTSAPVDASTVTAYACSPAARRSQIDNGRAAQRHKIAGHILSAIWEAGDTISISEQASIHVVRYVRFNRDSHLVRPRKLCTSIYAGTQKHQDLN